MSNEFDAFQLGDLVTYEKTGRLVWKITDKKPYTLTNKNIYMLQGAKDKGKYEFALEDQIALYAINEHAEEMLHELDENGEIPICDIIEGVTEDSYESYTSAVTDVHKTLKKMVYEYGKTVSQMKQDVTIRHFNDNEKVNKLLDEYAMILNTAEVLGGHTEYTETTMYEVEEKLIDILRDL